MGWVEDMGEPTTSKTDVLRASPPMFESRVLDALSRVHPLVPVLIFGPGIVALTAWGLSSESVPVRVPVSMGVKVIWRVQLVFAARVLPGVGQVPMAV